MTDKGLLDQVSGKAKEVVGNVTGDDAIKAEGFFEQVVGKTKEVAENVKDAVEEVTDKVKEKLNNND